MNRTDKDIRAQEARSRYLERVAPGPDPRQLIVLRLRRELVKDILRLLDEAVRRNARTCAYLQATTPAEHLGETMYSEERAWTERARAAALGIAAALDNQGCGTCYAHPDGTRTVPIRFERTPGRGRMVCSDCGEALG